MLLDNAPGACVEDVEEVMVEVTRPPKRKPSRWSSLSSIKDKSFAGILERATTALRLEVAYSKYGTPAKQCGGTPARIRRMATALSARALPPISDGGGDYERASSLLGIWSDIEAFAAEPWQQYGPKLQSESEAEFERTLRKRHNKAEDSARGSALEGKPETCGKTWNRMPAWYRSASGVTSFLGLTEGLLRLAQHKPDLNVLL
jgi:hypothetical protein